MQEFMTYEETLEVEDLMKQLRNLFKRFKKIINGTLQTHQK